MKNLKGWTGANLEDKKLIKFAMQFASFVKKEVEEVGTQAMDTTLPFDQKAILQGSESYIKSQLNITAIDFILLGTEEEMAANIPQKNSQNVTPGKPTLWMR